MKKYLLPIISFFVITTTLCHAQTPILWGMTSEGGTGELGNIFHTNASGSTFNNDFSFYVQPTYYPSGNVIQANNGLLYGMTEAGGINNKGTIFSYNILSGTDTVLYNFGNGTDGQNPYGSLIQVNNDSLYGMTYGGGINGGGTIFSYNISTGTETVLHNFGSTTDGAEPYGSLIQANNGLLYGMTSAGGTDDLGTIFGYNITTGTETVTHSFTGVDGASPFGSLIQAINDSLYGMTDAGGTNNKGIIFSYDISTDAEKDIHNFGSSSDGYWPYGSLMQASNGNLYGTTANGGKNTYYGMIFSYNISMGAETDLYDFGYGTVGYFPGGSLIQATNGLLYGMDGGGGDNNSGIIFSYDTTTHQETDIHDFGNGTDGFFPHGSLMLATNGLLYGLTYAGGINGGGIIFSFNISFNNETDEYDFAGSTYERKPQGSLIRATNGLFYGLTDRGGDNNEGTIFSYKISTCTETDLYSFGSGSDGAFPSASPIQATNGLLYGMTQAGGAYNGGTIFSYNISTKTETVLHNFGNGSDGDSPNGSLFQASNSLLYGMSPAGGDNNDGTIFSYNISTGSYTKVHDFGSGTDGKSPYYGPLIQANNDLLYGVTYGGGINNKGTIFSYNISTGTETDIYDFGSGNDGQYPQNSPIQANDSLLYGMTSEGGANDAGMIFSYKISTGKETDLHDFGSGYDGGNPYGSLIQASDSLLYGMTSVGGVNNRGIIFSYNISTGTETDIHNFASTDGKYPYANLIEDDTTSLTIYVTPSKPSICVGNSITFAASGATNYTWAPATGLSAITGDTVVATPSVTTTYSISASSGGCSATNTVTVTVNQNPIINAISSPSSYCLGGSSTLTASSDNTYTWSPSKSLSATTGDSVIANPTITTTYSITGTNSSGCSDSGQIIITVNPLPVLSISPNTPSVCSGQSLVLKASGGTTYIWSPVQSLNSSTGDSVFAAPLVQTTYTVTGTDSLGCTASSSDVVFISPVPDTPTITHKGNVLISSATQGNQWVRNDTTLQGATNQTYIVTIAGQYKVIAENPANGCNSTSDSTYFSPTGINQLSSSNNNLSIFPNPTSGQFIIKSTGNQNGYTLEVYNIMGEQVYQSVFNNLQKSIDLSAQPQGMYFVYLKSEEGVEIGKLMVVK